MPPPFVAYLRVYEPLRAFDEPDRTAIARAVATRPVDASRAGTRERELWLRALLAAPPRLLPGERPDGSPARVLPEVLVLDAADAPEAEAAEPWVCPLDLRARSAAGLLSFLDSSGPLLRSAALSVAPDAARGRADAVLAGVAPGALHVVSSTWTVPLPWFTLVDPAAHRVVAAPPSDGLRRVFWRAAMGDSRRRVARAYAVSKQSLGEEGPTEMLRGTGRWLQHFDGRSVVELDYGGLVYLMDDAALARDTSAADVHAAVDALEAGDAEAVARAYERLQDFWGELAMAQRTG